jgi:N-acylneuraminate cytidylyltransferase
MSRSVAIIPARGGSKRIPRKNIRPFAGKPMIAWSIEVALASGAFDEVIVSTDDEEIAAIATAHGASVPFLRPAELSGDTAAFMPVIRHALSFAQQPVDFACSIIATAPFLSGHRLAEAMKRLRNSEADFVLSVTPFDSPVQRSLRLSDDNLLTFANPEFALTRSQELEPRYHDAGQFFAGRVSALMQHDAVLFAKCLPVFIPRDEAVDIDTEDDWRFAEKLHALRSA